MKERKREGQTDGRTDRQMAPGGPRPGLLSAIAGALVHARKGVGCGVGARPRPGGPQQDLSLPTTRPTAWPWALL